MVREFTAAARAGGPFLLLLLLVAIGAFAEDAVPEALYPQRTLTRTLLASTAWADSFCLEDGRPGAAQGVGRQTFEAVQPCMYGAVRLGTGGDYLQFGQIGHVASAVADIGAYSNLKEATHAQETMPLATHFLGISVCDDGQQLCAATNHSGPDGAIVRQALSVPGLLETKSSSNFVPEIGHVYLLRLTPEPVVTQTPVENSTLLAKFTVNQQAAGVYTIQWTVFFGVPEHPHPHHGSGSGDEESGSSKHKDDGAAISTAEALSIAAMGMSAIALCAVVFAFVAVNRARNTVYAPINH